MTIRALGFSFSLPTFTAFMDLHPDCQLSLTSTPLGSKQATHCNIWATRDPRFAHTNHQHLRLTGSPFYPQSTSAGLKPSSMPYLSSPMHYIVSYPSAV
mmetsp:Transcript_71591/g.126014  ORF Transcript_71591/g.126014 Transcript_71591/m.126014 type:complete len:99 (+) Transcript_71591:322-618(+)